MTDSGHMQDSGAGGGGDVVRLISQARASMKARDYEAAKAGFKNIYDFLSRRGLGEGLEAMECLADLGATHMALKEYDSALSQYARLASIMERNLGEANAELRQHLRRYAQACDVAGKVNEAKQLYSRANDLERRYGAVPARSNAGSLTGRSQSGAQSAPSQEAASGGGSTFAEAIQDAVARSMAKLDNRGKPFDPATSQPPKQAPLGPRPFVSSPLPPSPFQNLVSEVTKPRDAGGAGHSGGGVPEQSQGQTPFQPQGQMQQQGQSQSAGPVQAQGQGQTPPQSQGQNAAQPLMPQGFTGSPAMPQDVAIPAFKVPRELSDSQFIYQPKGNAGQQTGGQSGTTTGGNSSTTTGGNSSTSTGGHSATSTGGQSATSTGGHSGTSTGGSQSGLGPTSSGGMRVSGGQPVAPTPQAKADPEAVQRAIAEHAAAKHAAAQQAEQQAASEFSSGWADSAQNNFPQQAEERASSIVQESEVPWADTQDATDAPGVGQSGTHWRAPRQPGTTSGDMSSISQDRPIIEEGNFEPISGARPNNHQSVEESLDKVFGQNAGPEQERGSSIYADQQGHQQVGPGSVSGEAGNSPVRRTNPSLNSSKLRQMQNRGTTPEPRPGLREDVEETTSAESFNTLAPLGYDPADYDPSVPTHPWAAPGQGAPPPSSDELRRPGAKRATAEWQVDPADDIPESSVDIADPHLPTEAHPDSDSSKAMAQWGVTISDQPEEHYPPIRQDDRRQGLQPVEEATPAGVPKPFDRRQKPKSMKNLRSRFGQIDPATEVDDAEFAESEVMNPHSATAQPSVSPVGPYEEDSPLGEPRSLPPQTPPRRLADNSISNMTPPELPPDQMLTQLPPEMPPPPPPSMKGRGPRGLLESSGSFAEASWQSEFEPQVQQDQTPPFDEGAPDDNRPSSMISRLVSKRQHDTSLQNANPSFASDELQVPPRIRSMVDAARANISDGKHADAARLMQKVVNDLAEGGLKDSRYVADCMLILSEAYEASGQLGPAITSFHQHALMVEKRVGVKDYESIGNWYRLAVLLEKAGEKDDARTMYEHALALAVQHLDQDDELTASIKSSYEEFLTNPDKATRKPAPTTEYSKEEVLAQNKELRTSALQQQEKPRNNGVVIWSTVSVIVLIAAGFWFFSLMGSMNKSIGNIDSVSTGTIPEQVFANTDGDGLLRFTGTDNLEVTIDGKLRQVKYIVLKNDLSDLATMFVNAGAKQTVWIRKAADGMLVDDNTMFFQKDAPELAMANEMRRIGQRVEEYYQLNRSYPRYRQDWSEDPAFGFINPTTHKGEASLFHVFPKSATQAALFGGSKTPDEIASYLESGETWVGEPELKPCSISVAVKHSGEKANNKPIVQEFFMHATDQNNKYLPASKPKTVSVVLLIQGRNIGNFDLHPQDFSKLELQPMPDGIAYVNMSETPLFGTDVLKSVVPVTFISLAAIFFFGLLITVATLRSNKKGTKKN